MNESMPGELLIRDATPQDSAVIAEIYNESIRAADSTMIDRPLNASDILHQIATFTEREGYVVLENKGVILGWGVIKPFSKEPAYRFTAETSVFLRRDEVGKGYGKRLKRFLIDRCRAYGYHHLVARIWARNTVSIEYNRTFGYEIVGIQREIGYMHDQWQDIALMQLVLS